MATRIQIRRGTESEWTAANPTLMPGEVGIESDTEKIKIGDGSTVWASLGYMTQGAAGTDGSKWYNGAGAPSTTHADGDYYLNNTNDDIYQQAAGAWGSAISNIKGTTGSAGPANSLAIGTVAEGTAAATITGTSPSQTLNLTVPKGDTGNTGPANSLSIGTVTEGTAAATITGTAPSQTLSLTVPKGNTGSAATVAAGTTTTGSAGTNASVANSGTSGAAVLDFTIPRGDQGDTGATGSAATVAAGSTTTGSAGSSASVANSGSSSAATFDFTIPRGDTGLTGADGAVWYTDAGAPSTTYNNGDFYLNGTNGDVYEQSGGSWGSAVANIKGASGSGSGDMLASTYDPTGVAGDAFDQDNMADGTSNKNYTAAEKTKLSGIEASADVTDTANVTSSGALMDSEVTNLAQVKSFDTSDYATATQGTKADNAATASSVSNVDNTSNATERAATATLTNKTINASDNTITNVSNLSVARQDNTTNSTIGGSRIETGWGVMTPGAAASASETVTFRTAFTDKPIVIITFGGDHASSSVYGDGNNNIKLYTAAKAVAITNTTFGAYVYTTDSTSYAAGNKVFYQWVAMGN